MKLKLAMFALLLIQNDPIPKGEMFLWAPKEDITTYELANLVPLFSGVDYGQGLWGSPEGAVVPKHVEAQGAWPCCRTVLFVTERKQKELGSAMRHLSREFGTR